MRRFYRHPFLLTIAILWFSTSTLLAQHAVRGTVTDQDGQPLVGATVVSVEDPGTGTISDIDGVYALELPDPTGQLRFSYTGYQELVVDIGNRGVIDITLQQRASLIDEVVVVGYGTQGRGKITSAIEKVDGDEIANLPVANPTQALQGRAAGVQITNQSTPGEDPVIRIRGLTTPNNNNPLIVIDGVPAGGLNALNASDIESFEVLKDASAASIYGSRAAGGVILITTKKGRAGRTQVTFDGFAGVQGVANRLDLLNTEQYIEVMSDQQINGGLPVPPRFDDQSIRQTSIDYQDEVFRTSPIQNYTLGISGGSSGSTFRVSLNYFNQQGIVQANDFERYQARINSEFNLTDNLKVGQNLNLSYTNATEAIRSGGRSIFEHTTKFPPYLEPRNPDNLGGFRGPDQIDNNDAENPLRVLLLGDHTNRNAKILGNVYGEWTIVEGLRFRSSLGIDFSSGRSFDWVPTYYDGEFHQGIVTTFSENRFTFFSPVWTNTLSYDRSLGGHSFGAVAGYEVQTFKTESLLGAGEISSTRNSSSPALVDQNENVGGSVVEDGLISYFGRINYDYEGRYLLQAAIRRDGYSRFGPNNKWGTFPSVSVGWNVAMEPFMQNNSLFSNLKLRASWGQVGNNNALGRYEYQPTVQTGFTYVFGPGNVAQGASIPGLANEDLRWESTTMTNFGVDIGLWEDALTFTAEYFINNTEDILLSVPLASSLGLDRSVRVNAGEVESTGFEFNLGYQNRSGAFRWGINANFGTQDNEVISLGSGNPINGAGWQGDVLTRVEEGEPLYYFQGWLVDRLFQESDFDADGNLNEGIPTQGSAAPGDIKFQDVSGPRDENGNPTGPDGVIDANDRVNIGSPLPTYTYGINLNAEWNNFDLTAFFQGVGGNKIFKAYAYWTQGMTRVFNGEAILMDRWTPTNTDTEVPRAISGDPNRNARASDRFLDDGDFFRLKNLTLGYTIGTDQIGFLSRLRLYASAQNLLTFTAYEGYDPEIGARQGANTNNSFGIDYGQLPQARTFMFGVQATF